MLKIYGMNISSPANKVRYTAEALDLDYEFNQINLAMGEGQKPEYLTIHPLGKVPAIDDNGFRLFESDAICRYLAGKKVGDFYPADLKERALIDQWADYATSHIMNAVSKILFNKVFYKFVGAEVDTRSLNEGEQWFQKYMPVIEAELSKSSNLAGDKMTLADIHLLAALDPCETAEISLVDFPATSKWRNELIERKFYQAVHSSFLDSIKALSA